MRKGVFPETHALSLGMMVESAAQSWAVMGLEPFETPLDVERLNEQMTAIWCRAVYRDPDAPMNNFERPRVPLDEQVKFVGF